MGTKPHRKTPTRAVVGYLAVGAVALAASLVLASGVPAPNDVGEQAILGYVRSVEQNDIVSACRHASSAAETYLRQREDAVGLGWQTIAHAVCPEGQIRNVAYREP